MSAWNPAKTLGLQEDYISLFKLNLIQFKSPICHRSRSVQYQEFLGLPIQMFEALGTWGPSVCATHPVAGPAVLGIPCQVLLWPRGPSGLGVLATQGRCSARSGRLVFTATCEVVLPGVAALAAP